MELPTEYGRNHEMPPPTRIHTPATPATGTGLLEGGGSILDGESVLRGGDSELPYDDDSSLQPPPRGKLKDPPGPSNTRPSTGTPTRERESGLRMRELLQQHGVGLRTEEAPAYSTRASTTGAQFTGRVFPGLESPRTAASRVSTIKRMAPQPPPERVPTPPADVWFGLTEGPPGQRTKIICGTIRELRQLLTEGATQEQSFLTEEDTTEWLQTADEYRRLGRPPPATQPLAPQVGPTGGTIPPQNVPRSGRGRNLDAREQLPQAHISQERTRLRRVNFNGVDPSTGDKTRIWGVEWRDQTVMDSLLVPEDLTLSEGRRLISQAADIGALPGTYAVRDSEDEFDTATLGIEGLSAVLQQKTSDERGDVGHDPLWRRRCGLKAIKSFDDLIEFVPKVEEARLRCFDAMEAKMDNVLTANFFHYDEIQVYVKQGFLPSIIRETYYHYHALLNTLRGIAYRQGRDRWKGFQAEAVLKYHREEMRVIRENAGSYRALVLETYVFLRDQEERKFQPKNPTNSLWDRLAAADMNTPSSQAASSPSPAPAPGARAPEGNERCPHCHRRGMHTGGKAKCPAKDLPYNQAQKALRLMNDLNAAKKIVTIIGELQTADPGMSNEDAANEARRQVLIG